MTDEQRWQRIEEVHRRIDEKQLALHESIEKLTRDIREMRQRHDRLDARERRAYAALLTGVEAYRRIMDEGNGQENA